jgi:tetratricopeptide (TPR) repeat protein
MSTPDEHGRKMKADVVETSDSARRERVRDAALVAVVVAGLACAFALTRWLDARRPAQDEFASYEENYVSPETARRMSLGFNGIAADWYWIRSLQYVGRKSLAAGSGFTLDDLGTLGIKNLGPMLEHATTLDPQFLAAYEFGAVVLPSVDENAAVRLLEKGVRENPSEWRIFHNLGFIHWQAGRYKEAGKAYSAGASVAGAPAWMHAMAAQMEANGGSRAVAREMYARLYEGTSDAQIKMLAASRLTQLLSLDERDAIRRALSDFRARASRCPASWREVAPLLRPLKLKLDSSGAPLDPLGVPYVLDPAACDVRLDERSEIPKK